MAKFRISYISFAGETPKRGSRIVQANTIREAIDALEKQHPEFSTTSAKKIH